MKGLLRKINLYYHTVRHLKARQISYQIFYRLKRLGPQTIKISSAPVAAYPVKLTAPIAAPVSYQGEGVFKYLNKEKNFSSGVDWNFMEYGKLWGYNLNYFDFLQQENIQDKELVRLIDSFCEHPEKIRLGIEPYTISLRVINWIKFFSRRGINNQKYNAILYAHSRHLANNLEYHLLGNHLLENGFSLLFASFYFRNPSYYSTAKKILTEELREQILDDGAHFELSPMYHQILLCRLLDCVNLVKNNPWQEDELGTQLESTAQKMTGWLEAVTFSNGDIPMVNDSAFGIAPNSAELVAYAHRLGIKPAAIQLSDSGYKMVRGKKFELFVDIGNIGPDYIPGHSHSDTLNFLLYVHAKPVIVDVGTSTYDIGITRLTERSTRSHNTVSFMQKEQSDVWASFRVGKRAKIIETKSGNSEIMASHDGYRTLVVHTRSWLWSEQHVEIVDEMTGSGSNKESEAYIHFHPSVNIQSSGGSIKTNDLEIQISSPDFRVEEYKFATGFNSTQSANVLVISFKGRLSTKISWS